MRLGMRATPRLGVGQIAIRMVQFFLRENDGCNCRPHHVSKTPDYPSGDQTKK